MDLKGVGCDAKNWMDLAEGRGERRACVRAVMNLRIPKKPISYNKQT